MLISFITCARDDSAEFKKPQLSINLASFTFTKSVKAQALIITNNGGKELAWEIIEKADWIAVSKNSGQITITADTVIMAADVNQQKGAYRDTVKIISNGGNENIDILLNLETWIPRAPMPTPRYAFGTCVVGNKIYAIGGWNGTQSLATVEEYNPATDTWTQKASMPTPKYLFATCAVNDKIYVIGGNTTFPPVSPLATVEEYDPITDSWTTKASMITPRGNVSACLLNGKIYVIGGLDSLTVISTVEEYDPATDSWTTKADLPIPKWGHKTFTVNNKIYVLKGATSSGSVSSAKFLKTVEEYNPSTDIWEKKADALRINVYFAASAANGKIYTIGGSPSKGNAISMVEEYDPLTDTWIIKQDMPTARWNPSSSVVNRQIFVIGGTKGGENWQSEPLSVVEAYDP